MIDEDIDEEPIPAPAPGTVRKCSRVGWCAGMRLALADAPENHEGKGLSVSRGWLNEKGPAKLLGVTYHARARDQGIVLNFCPWCATRIRFNE